MTCALFVNSSDGFQDCWPPFFRLLDLYGGSVAKLSVYLNTERAEYRSDRCNVSSTKVWPVDEAVRPTWSECLIRGLDCVKESHVLYMQEDYFLNGPVRDDLVEEAIQMCESNPEIAAVYLSKNGPRVRESEPYSTNFCKVCPPARYLISTQAAVWNKNYLRSLARSWENAWMFEKFATLRARNSKQLFLTTTPEAREQGEGLDYVFSGVIKGQWKRECVELFARNQIEINFDKRGFYHEGSLWKYRMEVLKKLYGRPVPAIRSILSLAQASR